METTEPSRPTTCSSTSKLYPVPLLHLVDRQWSLRAFHIVKAFIEMGTLNTIESLQALYVQPTYYFVPGSESLSVQTRMYPHRTGLRCHLFSYRLPHATRLRTSSSTGSARKI